MTAVGSGSMTTTIAHPGSSSISLPQHIIKAAILIHSLRGTLRNGPTYGALNGRGEVPLSPSRWAGIVMGNGVSREEGTKDKGRNPRRRRPPYNNWVSSDPNENNTKAVTRVADASRTLALNQNLVIIRMFTKKYVN